MDSARKLLRALGNQATARLLEVHRCGPEPCDCSPERQLAASAYAGLPVSHPSDPAERDAEHMADQVLRRGDDELAAPRPHRRDPAGVVYRAVAAGTGTAGPMRDALAGGRPLDPATRAWFEPRFGVSLDGVRVHTGRAAAESARELHARAFTVGTDIAFGEGEYAAETTAGRRLIAHELAHAIHPGGAGVYRQTAPADNDSPVMLNDPSGLDPSKPRVTPMVTDVEPTGVAGELQFHDLFSSDRSVSGRGELGLRARFAFLLQVPQFSLNTPGLADLSALAAVDTSLGRAGARFEGGLLLGESSGLHLGLRGAGTFRFSVPERIGIDGLPGSLLPALTQGEGTLRLSGALGSGSWALVPFRARAELAGGRFEGSLDATGIADLARLRLDATGAVSPSGGVSLGSARLLASAGIPGFRLDARVSGTGTGQDGLNVRGNADLTLFGLPSLHAITSGTVSSSGVDLTAWFSGAGPLYTSYITGGLDYSSHIGLSGHASVFGLTYTPGISLQDPSPASPGTAAVLGSPASPWTPSGLTLGASYFGYRQGLLYSVSGGVTPDLSERILTNPRFGVSAQWHF